MCGGQPLWVGVEVNCKNVMQLVQDGCNGSHHFPGQGCRDDGAGHSRVACRYDTGKGLRRTQRHHNMATATAMAARTSAAIVASSTWSLASCIASRDTTMRCQRTTGAMGYARDGSCVRLDVAWQRKQAAPSQA
ncbi:hypothetical protein PSPO01_03975 [Paraphaeosphaeria sporulosa]